MDYDCESCGGARTPRNMEPFHYTTKFYLFIIHYLLLTIHYGMIARFTDLDHTCGSRLHLWHTTAELFEHALAKQQTVMASFSRYLGYPHLHQGPAVYRQPLGDLANKLHAMPFYLDRQKHLHLQQKKRISVITNQGK